MRIVVPLAGKDPRFESAGVCKPLLMVEGKPLIEFCIGTLSWPFSGEHELDFIILKEHDKRHNLGKKLKRIFPESEVHLLEQPTDGAARTVLTLGDIIDRQDELVVYLADIHFKGDVEKVVAKNPKAGGIIPVFESDNPKYSYAIADRLGRVFRVAEKKVISRNASAGLYYYREGRHFVNAAKEMIRKEDRTNNAFYICPTYNYLLDKDVLIAPVEFVADFGRDDFIRRWLK